MGWESIKCTSRAQENISGITRRFSEKNHEREKYLDYSSMSSALIYLSDVVIPNT
jgi:hypothetical protein